MFDLTEIFNKYYYLKYIILRVIFILYLFGYNFSHI